MKFSCLKIDTIYLISILLFQRYIINIILYFKIEFHDIQSIHDIYFHLSVVVIVYLTTRARNASKRMNHDICPNSYIRYSGIYGDMILAFLYQRTSNFHSTTSFNFSSLGYQAVVSRENIPTHD